MNARKNRWLLLGGVLLLLATVGSTAWTKRWELFPDSIRNAIRSARSEPRRASGDAAEREKARRMDALYAAVMAKHPGLEVTYKDVPDDRNGFLKWNEFAKRFPGASFDLPDEIQRMIEDKGWDAEKVAEWMNGHADLIAEIMEIGLMPDESAKGITFPKNGNVQFKLARDACALLMLRARLEAERGSPDASLRSFQATTGLAGHFDQIETPSLLHATVAMILRSGANHQFFDKILPALPGDSLDLSAWQQSFGPASSTEDFSRLLIGEWHTGARYIALPALVSGEQEWKDVDDPAALLDRWADLVEAQAKACGGTDLGHLPETLGGIHVGANGDPRSTALMDELARGLTAWSKGWVRQQIQCEQQNAVFAYLRGEPLPNEPTTGKPFVWDEASQSVRLPEDDRLKDFHLDPIAIKRSVSQ